MASVVTTTELIQLHVAKATIPFFTIRASSQSKLADFQHYLKKVVAGDERKNYVYEVEED